MLRRTLVTLGLCLGLIATGITPAHASYAGERTRAGASTWVPRQVDFLSQYDAATNKSVFVFGFDWYQQEHMAQLDGAHRAFEINADVDCAWAYWTGGNSGYDPTWFDTNIPKEAFPYEDTMFHPDPPICVPGGTNEIGVGVLQTEYLVPGTHYYIRVGTNRAGSSMTDNNVKLKVDAGIIYDINKPYLVEDNADCAWTAAEINTWWNPANPAGGHQLRLEGSWCVFTDWSHTVIRRESSQLELGEVGSQYFNVNHLSNQGFEEGTPGTGGSVPQYANIGSRTKYCEPGAYDGACFVQFNRGAGSYGSIWQDDTTTLVQSEGGAVDQLRQTMEVALRCRAVDGSVCGVELRLFKMPNWVEYRSMNTGILNNGFWYLCRFDVESARRHVQDNDVAAVSGMSFGPNDWLRWEVYNLSPTGQNMDIDFSFIGGKTTKEEPAAEAPEVGNPPLGSHCTKRVTSTS